MRGTCSFLKFFTLSTTGTQAARFIPNGIYDVDPIVGSTTAIGFGEYMATYRRFRVTKYRYVIQCVNADTNPAQIYVCNVNFDPGTVLGQYYDYARNNYGQYAIVAPTGKNVCSFAKTIVPSMIYGERLSTLTADQFFGQDNQNPSNLMFLGIAVQPIVGATLAVGVGINLTLYMEAEFFERKTLTS